MPSPFPGMDPYLEDPDVWPDFHNELASEIRGRLNPLIRPRYVARLNPKVEYEVVEIGETRLVRPDTAVWKRQPAPDSGIAVVRIPPAPVQSVIAVDLPVSLNRVEIHEVGTRRLVTVIELLAPTNKRGGHAAQADYLEKRRDLLRAPVHFLEIDLLRGGVRPPLERPVPPAPYYIMCSRRESRPTVDVWPVELRERLPVLPIPLLAPDPDVPLDLGAAVTAVYDRAGYVDLIDYRQAPPAPALSAEDAVWVEALLAALRGNLSPGENGEG